MCVMGLVLGWLGNVLIRVREQRSVIAKLRSLDGKLLPVPGLPFGWQPLTESEWTRWPLDDDLIARLPGVLLEKPNLRDADLTVLAELPGLQSLMIKDGPGVTDNSLRHLTRASKLCNLALFNTRVTVGGISQLPARDSLQVLWLGGTTLTDESLAHLDGLPNLRMLNIGGSPRVTDAGMAHLANLEHLDPLSLSGTAVTDRGLAQLGGLTRLRLLTVLEKGVSDAGMQHLSRLTELRSLRLGETNVGDAGIAQLSRLDKLGNLDLMPSAVTDAGLRSLAEMSSLKHLTLGRGVTRAGAVELKASLPQCEIWFWEDNNWATLK